MSHQYTQCLDQVAQYIDSPCLTGRVADKYEELCNFKMEVKKNFMTNNYNTQKSERVHISLNWIGWECLRFMQTLNDKKQENCKKKHRIVNDKFKPQHNETSL